MAHVPPHTSDGVPLVAVVVTYNRLEKLKKTLESILSEPCEAVIVVDNGSGDGTRSWLSDHADPRVLPVFANHNLGGAGGFELGLREALERSAADWFVVMDDDARPMTGAFREFARNGAGTWDLVVAAVYYPDGHICEMNRPSRNPFWHLSAFAKTSLMALFGKGREGFHISDAAYTADQVVPVDAGSFVGMFISRSVLDAIGLPDGKFSSTATMSPLACARAVQDTASDLPRRWRLNMTVRPL